MALSKTFIPYGAYWSSPFCRWQGALSGENSVQLAAATARRFLAQTPGSAEALDRLVTGFTVPQKHSFYGSPWVAGMMGVPNITGPTIAQACATSTAVMQVASTEIENGLSETVLGLTADRTSNGPHIAYPNPAGFGGKPDAEDWVWDNFNKDPYAKGPMIATAENVAKEAGITKAEQDEMTLLRHEQYKAALADDRAFQKRYMFPIEIGQGKRAKLVAADEGVFPTTPEGLAKLGPVLPDGGTVSFGTQTYPADGNAGMVLTTREKAAALSKDAAVSIQVLGFGGARVKAGHMPMAVVPAAQRALSNAGVSLGDIKVIKTHNPFAVNDVYFCKQTGVAPEALNNYGSPLIFGHPQGPTGMRAVIEMIEELVLLGGGLGIISGCAAGDTAMGLVVRGQ
jgi:acetyl-CoA acetyltransferase